MNSADNAGKAHHSAELDPDFADDGILRPDPASSGQATSITWDAQRHHLAFTCDTPQPRLYRASRDGELDPTFGAGTGYVPVIFVAGQSARADHLLHQPDGKLTVLGRSHRQPLPLTDPALARFEADGHPDQGFGSNGVVLPDVIPDGATPTGPIHGALQADGKILITYRYYILDDIGRLYLGVVARLENDGSLDRSFGQDGMVVFHGEFDYELGAVLQQPDGNIVLGAIQYARPSRATLVKLTHSGEIDRSFGHDGHAPVASQAAPQSIIQDPLGRLICTGEQFLEGQSGAVVLRFHADGSPDHTFKDTYRPGCHWQDLGILSDGRILAVGEGPSRTSLFASLKADGALEQLLPGGSGEYRSLALQESIPRYVVAGDLSGTPAVFGIRPGSLLPDHTDFVDYNWNGWEKGPGAADPRDLVIRQDNELWYLWNYTYTNNSDGIILRKTFTLEPGRSYEFSVEAKRYNNNGAIPILSTTANGLTVGAEQELADSANWTTINGTFSPTVNSVELAVVSHVATGHGNDYMIRDILVRERP